MSSSHSQILSDTRHIKPINNYLRDMFTSLKEISQSIYFTFLVRQGWIMWIMSSPLLLVIMPMMGLGLGGLGLLDFIDFVRNPDKSLENWLKLLTGPLPTLLMLTAFSFTLLKSIVGISFSVTPWLQIGSLSMFAANALAKSMSDLMKVIESNHDSEQRKVHLQSFIHNALNMITLAMIVAMIFTAVIFPVSEPLAAFFAVSAVTLTLTKLSWRLSPNAFKQSIKEIVGLHPNGQEQPSVFKKTQRLHIPNNPLKPIASPTNRTKQGMQFFSPTNTASLSTDEQINQMRKPFS